MGLRAKIANKPILDTQGYVTGKIDQILELDERIEKQGKKDIKYAAQFLFKISSKGSQKDINFNIWVGQNINPEKFKVDEKLQFNRLTTLLLNLQFIEEKDLENLSENSKILDSLESLEGKEVKFKLESSKKNPTFKNPNINTIKIVE